MFTLKVENKKGECLSLTNTKNYNTVRIDGLNPIQANVNFSESPNADGKKYNSSRVDMRNIVLTIIPTNPVEQNRLELYKYFLTNQWVKLYYSNKNLDVQIEGIVETHEIDFFSQSQSSQISILCPSPFFEAINAVMTDISNRYGNFTFPFAIDKAGIPFGIIKKDAFAVLTNKGTITAGVEIEIVARGSVENPIIFNSETRGRFGFNLTLEKYDRLMINCVNKTVKLVKNGVERNAINYIQKNPEWFTLVPGDNIFSYSAASGSDLMSITFKHRTLYGGV